MPRLARNELEGEKFIHVMVQGIKKEKESDMYIGIDLKLK